MKKYDGEQQRQHQRHSDERQAPPHQVQWRSRRSAPPDYTHMPQAHAAADSNPKAGEGQPGHARRRRATRRRQTQSIHRPSCKTKRHSESSCPALARNRSRPASKHHTIPVTLPRRTTHAADGCMDVDCPPGERESLTGLAEVCSPLISVPRTKGWCPRAQHRFGSAALALSTRGAKPARDDRRDECEIVLFPRHFGLNGH